MKKLLILPLIVAALAGCQNYPKFIQNLGTPDEVQQEVTAMAAMAKVYVPSKDVAVVHQYASALAQNAAIVTTPPPTTGHPKTDAFIKSSVALLDLALLKLGAAAALPYQHAVGNGILTSF